MTDAKETTEHAYRQIPATEVKPTETITYVRVSGEAITGVVESVNIDPALGVVAVSYLTNTPYKAPPVLTIPLDAEVYVHH